MRGRPDLEQADPDLHEPEGLNRPQKRSLSIAGHRTSISLERAFWDALQAAAAEDGQSLASLVRSIDEGRTIDDRSSSGLSSAIRVYLLRRALSRTSSGSGPQ